VLRAHSFCGVSVVRYLGFFPFSLSGGQKKKRISGIVLDEHHLIFHLVIDDSYF
jgi:hypothetical protein